MKLIRITTVPQSLRTLLKGQLKFMKYQNFEVIGISSEGKALEEVRNNEEIDTIAVNMSRSISPIKDLISLIKLYRIIKKENPEIVHTHTPKAGLLGMIASKIAGVPKRYHTVAGLPLLVTKGKKRKLLNFIEYLTYACATKVYPNSFVLEEIIIKEKFAKPSKLKVLGNGSSNGIDIDYFNPDLISSVERNKLKLELDIKENDFVFIYVGRLVRDKGINELIEAFVDIKIDNAKLLLVGAFEENLDPINSFSKEQLYTNDNIIYVGHQSDVRPYFSIANALTFPSYREGFPNVVMQAGAMGLPSIVTNINGCNEIVIDNVNGNIIPTQNKEALKEKMIDYIVDKTYYNQIKNKSREMIASRYKREIIWNALLEEYNK